MSPYYGLDAQGVLGYKLQFRQKRRVHGDGMSSLILVRRDGNQPTALTVPLQQVANGRGAPGLVNVEDKDGGELTPDELVDQCMDLMGPIASNERSRSTLVEHVARQGDLSLRDHQRGDDSEKRVADLLGLIASTREYQLG